MITTKEKGAIMSKINAIQIRDDLLFCIHDPSFDDFTILAQVTNTFLLEIKESLLTKRDKPMLNKNISFAPLLFDKV